MHDAAEASLQREVSEARAPFLQRLFAKSLFALDRLLQWKGGVFCYTTDPKCVFRISLKTIEEPLILNNGLELPAGSPIAELHFWNEHLPGRPKDIDPAGWDSLSRTVKHSLR